MKEALNFVWTQAPQLVSVLVMTGFLMFLIYKVTMYHSRLEARLDRIESDITAMKKDINKILEYLVTGKVEILKKK